MGSTFLSVPVTALIIAYCAASTHRAEEYNHEFELAESVLLYHPDDAFIWYHLGLRLYDYGRQDEALADLRHAVELQPNYCPLARYHIAKILSNRGDFPGAIKELRRAIAEQPKFSTARNNLGTLLCQQGQLAEGADEFCKALDVNPKYRLARENLLYTLATARERNEAALALAIEDWLRRRQLGLRPE